MADQHDDTVYFNGVDPDGQYLVPPMGYEALAKRIRSWEFKGDQGLQEVVQSQEPHLGLEPSAEESRIESAGWAIVFHKHEEPAVRNALEPLIQHRKTQVPPERFKQLEYPSPNGATVPRMWLHAYGVGRGSVRPKRVPFYLLVVGSPERIPFEFTRDLAVEYCVGRLYFPTAGEYSRYVNSLLEYERGTIRTTREVVFFGPRRGSEDVAHRAIDGLLTPLAEGNTQLGIDAVPPRVGFQSQLVTGSQATRAKLASILSPAKDAAPAFLFTASHGRGLPYGAPRQEEEQGALLCQEELGHRASMSDDFSAQVLPADAKLHGLMACLFACYSAGTKELHSLPPEPGRPPQRLAARPFIAALPQRLLAQGALACIGHIDQAYGYSFINKGSFWIDHFMNMLERALKGEPVGLAMRELTGRYASLATEFAKTLYDEKMLGQRLSDKELGRMWLEVMDAGGYLLLGDPAARIDPRCLSR